MVSQLRKLRETDGAPLTMIRDSVFEGVYAAYKNLFSPWGMPSKLFFRNEAFFPSLSRPGPDP